MWFQSVDKGLFHLEMFSINKGDSSYRVLKHMCSIAQNTAKTNEKAELG